MMRPSCAKQQQTSKPKSAPFLCAHPLEKPAHPRLQVALTFHLVGSKLNRDKTSPWIKVSRKRKPRSPQGVRHRSGVSP